MNRTALPVLLGLLLAAAAHDRETWAQPTLRIIEADGIVRARHDITVGSTIEGKVERIAAREGSDVRRGDLILELDNEAYALSLALAEVQFASQIEMLRAEANLKKAALDVKRNDDLFGQKIISETEMEVYRLNHEIAKINLQAEIEMRKQLEINAKLRRKQLEDTRIRSPIDGVVVKLMFDVGEVVDEMRPVARIVDIHNLQAHVNLPADALGSVSIGTGVTVLIDQHRNREFLGKVAFIEPVVDPQSRTFGVKVDLGSPPPSVKPGLMARVRFAVQPTRASRP